jgi:hypothetical protein
MINIYLWLTVTQERLVGLSILSRETNIVEKLDVKQLICTITDQRQASYVLMEF